jgi:hypothetical protein
MASEEGWWEPDPADELNQGDVLIGVPFIVPATPIQPLVYQALPGGRGFGYVAGSEKPGKDGRSNYLASGRTGAVLLLNHSCDIDKPQNRRLVCLDVRAVDELNPDQREVVRSGRSRNQLFLPSVPTLGDCFVDMRTLSVVPRDVINNATRVAVMTNTARHRLQAQVVEFFLRLDLDEILAPAKDV